MTAHYDVSQVVFQPVDSSDCGAARQLCLDVIKEIYGFEYLQTWATDLDDIVGRYQSQDGGIFYTALVGREVIGAAAVRCINRDERIFSSWRVRYGSGSQVGMITRAYVRQSVRGQGIGLKLIEKVEGFAWDFGYRTIYLHTHRTQRFDPVLFWSRRGYQVILEEEHAEQTVHMEKTCTN